MLTKLLKSLLSVVEDPRSLPTFITLYLLTWLIWHNQLFIDFFAAQGGFSNKISAAITGVSFSQTITVFWLTIFLFILRAGFIFFIKSSRKYVEQQEENNHSIEQADDIKRLITTLAEVNAQLARAINKEKQAKANNKESINKLLAAQAELDEINADNLILKQENQQLTEKLALKK
jgi:hypothetical protein